MYSNDGSKSLAPDKDFLKNFKGYEINLGIPPNQSSDIEKIALTMENKSLKSEITKLQTNSLDYGFIPPILPDQSSNFEKIALIMENKSLEAKVTKLENLAYNLQVENSVLRSQAEVARGIMQLSAGVDNMELYKTPIKWILSSAFVPLVIGLILLFYGVIRMGATLSFLSSLIFFVALYALWRFNNIAVLRPKIIVLGFVVSLGLFATGITSLIM